MENLVNILEALLLATAQPLSIDKIKRTLADDVAASTKDILNALQILATNCAGRSIELKEVASGYRLQIRTKYSGWVQRLWEEKPPKYSRSLLETLAIIAYRQPITRAEIEVIRGVAVSSHIIKTLQEREWIKLIGYKDVPGKPGLYATTRQFLDYFNINSLEQLPTLQAIQQLDERQAQQVLAALAEQRANQSSASLEALVEN